MNSTAIRTAESPDWKRLALIAASAIVVMVGGIEDVFGNRLSALLLLIYTVFPIVLVGFNGVGFTRKEIGRSILTGSVVGFLYGIIRGLFLRFVPGGDMIFGADLAILMPRLQSGIQLGPLLIKGYWMLPLGILLTPVFMGIETYFRGFVFLNLRKRIHWTAAVAIASAIQAVARRTPHSLILGSIGGILMQRFNNIWAPLFFHLVQILTAAFVAMA